MDHHSKHVDISAAFKELTCEALADTVQFYLTQMDLPAKKQDKRRLDLLSTLMLSRMMPKICDFQRDESTKVHQTEFNWNIILGQFEPIQSHMGVIHSSHPVVMNSNKVEILFY